MFHHLRFFEKKGALTDAGNLCIFTIRGLRNTWESVLLVFKQTDIIRMLNWTYNGSGVHRFSALAAARPQFLHTNWGLRTYSLYLAKLFLTNPTFSAMHKCASCPGCGSLICWGSGNHSAIISPPSKRLELLHQCAIQRSTLNISASRLMSIKDKKLLFRSWSI